MPVAIHVCPNCKQLFRILVPAVKPPSSTTMLCEHCNHVLFMTPDGKLWDFREYLQSGDKVPV